MTRRIDSKQIADIILNSPRSIRRQFVFRSRSNERITLQGKEYALPLVWSGVGTQRSYHENPEKILPYLDKNIFDFGDNQGDRYYSQFHIHLEVPPEQLAEFPLAVAGTKRYGAERFYTLSSYADIEHAVSSVDRNNKVSQIYLGKQIDTKLIGLGICAVQPGGKVGSIGFLDIDALGRDGKALNKVMTFIDMMRKREAEGQETVPYLDELLPVLDVINDYTLHNRLPDWFDQGNGSSSNDPNLSSIGGIDMIRALFQSHIDEQASPNKLGEFAMYGISINQKRKCDTLVKPLLPRIMIPYA
ncbi:MAG: hypothetical protein KIT50_15955 [Bacteroidetes bacterium]|nr:hypothetical protein [Bacteroidota bacterium]